MEILFKQESKSMPLAERLGIENCMLKLISLYEDRSNITKQRHYHSAIEIHIITKGGQKYDIDGKQIVAQAGEFLMIMPHTEHIALEEKQATMKYAIVFDLAKGSPAEKAALSVPNYIYAPLPDEIKTNMEKIISEKTEKKPYFSAVIANRLEESLLCFLRIMGAKEEIEASLEDKIGEDGRVSLVKQYINDNICRTISLGELASYCYISQRQLSRIFTAAEGISISDYIRQKKCEKITALLTETQLPLREISDAMGFDNEYYFNTFYKKYAGMSPGAYRRSVSK
jgi:AraC-like DNA-binding protein